MPITAPFSLLTAEVAHGNAPVALNMAFMAFDYSSQKQQALLSYQLQSMKANASDQEIGQPKHRGTAISSAWIYEPRLGHPSIEAG